MTLCSKCQSRAMWICRCSSIYLCKDHAGEHSMSHFLWKTNPELVQIEFSLSENERKDLISEIERRIVIIESYKKQIAQNTLEYIKKIEILCKNSIKNLNKTIAEYQEFIGKTYFDEETWKKIQKILRTCIDPYNKGKNLVIHQNVVNYYNRKFLKEIEFFQNDVANKLNSDFNLCVEGHILYVYCVAISNDDKYAASGSHDMTIRIWNIKKNVQECYFVGHQDKIFSLEFTPDGKYLLSCSADTTVRIWDINQRNQHAILQGHIDYVWKVSASTKPPTQYPLRRI